MRWFAIKRDVEIKKVSQVTVSSIREKLQDYQPSQGPSEFLGPVVSLSDTLFIESKTEGLNYYKVEVEEDQPLPKMVPFTVH